MRWIIKSPYGDMKQLYPELEPIAIHQLDRPGGHCIYVEQCGNPQGLPVIFLHGGPGSGCNANHRRYFNPDKYHIILFDQRGAGRSTPHGYLEQNTIQALVQDMDAIRTHLNIGQWLLFGGSWGSALALLYAETYPQHISGLILRGSFLARNRDLEWFIRQGAINIFPDYWQKFCDAFAKHEQDDLISACYQALLGNDADKRLAAAKAWANWGNRVVCNTQSEASPSHEEDTKENAEDIEKLIRRAALEMHYAINHYFIADNQILNNIERIPQVPVTLIHGRRDMICPVESSWLLHQALPQSTFKILANTGHLLSEPAMIDALLSASDEMVNIIAK
ncbi:MAG: proline iminopeptidase [Candidatus Azotimanducaceae bacterium]|jgi:proline iminopeptidase